MDYIINDKHTPYFSVKLLAVKQSIDNGLTWTDYKVTQDTKDQLWYETYYLINNKHYHPDEFISYMNNIRNNNRDSIFKVFFKYIFFNHPIDNEYQNIFTINKNDIKIEIN